MELDDPGIENGLVRLEIFGPEHFDALKASGAEEFMWKAMPVIPKGVSFDAYTKYIQTARAEGDIIPFAVFRKHDNAFAGVTSYGLHSRLHRRVRIAYTWHPEDMRGSLIFPAGQSALIQRALDWGARRIAWTVDSRNKKAFASLKRLGAQHEGTMRNFMRMVDGTWADHHIMAVTREEAKAIVESVENRIAQTKEVDEV